MRKSQKYSAEIVVEGHVVPVIAYIESRYDVRFGINKKGVNVRLPRGISKEDIGKQLRQLESWVSETVARKPDLRPLLFNETKAFRTGDVITVGQRSYTLHVIEEDRETHSARLRNGTIYLSISEKSAPRQREKSVRQLLSRVVAGDYLPEITRRVLDLNRQHFNQPIRSVSLKYNHSNWGSCSSRRSVNLSTRLLFAPEAVQDYVIIHELAHLIHMNHSEAFWSLVAQAMPDFEEHERWLKKHGKTCDF